MFESIINHFKKLGKKEELSESKKNKDTAKERLHLVLMQDRANVSADFLDMMKQEIIDVIKKYIDVDENSIDVKLTNKQNSDGTTGAPALYANIPIISIKDEARKVNGKIEIEKSKEDAKKVEEKKSEKDDEEKLDANNNDKEDNNNVVEEKADSEKTKEDNKDKEESKKEEKEIKEDSKKESNEKAYQVVKPNNKSNKQNNKKKKR